MCIYPVVMIFTQSTTVLTTHGQLVVGHVYIIYYMHVLYLFKIGKYIPNLNT